MGLAGDLVGADLAQVTRAAACDRVAGEAVAAGIAAAVAGRFPEPMDVEGRTVGPFYSMAEIMLRGRRQWVRYEMDKLHDRVMRLRDCIPPDPL